MCPITHAAGNVEKTTWNTVYESAEERGAGKGVGGKTWW